MNDTSANVPSPRINAKRVGLSRIVVIVFVGIVAIFVTWFSPLGSQKRNLLAAQRHASLIGPQVHADVRFRQVRIETFTGLGGCLWVGGLVGSEEDGNALRVLVASTKPPILARFMIFVPLAGKELPGHVRLEDLKPGGL